MVCSLRWNLRRRLNWPDSCEPQWAWQELGAVIQSPIDACAPHRKVGRTERSCHEQNRHRHRRRGKYRVKPRRAAGQRKLSNRHPGHEQKPASRPSATLPSTMSCDFHCANLAASRRQNHFRRDHRQAWARRSHGQRRRRQFFRHKFEDFRSTTGAPSSTQPHRDVPFCRAVTVLMKIRKSRAIVNISSDTPTAAVKTAPLTPPPKPASSVSLARWR